MADKKEDYETPQEESDVDRINSFVVSSKDEKLDDEVETKSDYAEEKAEDAEESAEEVKEEETEKETKKAEHETQKKPAVAHPKRQPAKHAAKPEAEKEEKKEVKNTIHKKHTETRHDTKAEKAVHTAHKKPEIKKEQVRDEVKKSKEVTTMKKTKNHKTKENKTKSKFTKNTFIWIGIGVLAAALVIAIVLLVSPNKNGTPEGNETAKSVAATVNGEAIYLQDIQKEYESLNPLLKQMYTLETILDKDIDSVLLSQESKAMDITVSDKEIQGEIDVIKEQNQMNDEEFELALEKQGMTLEGVEELVRENLMIKKFLNETILKNLTITDSNIKAYYQLNIEKFATKQQVTIQHILVMTGDNVTEEQAKDKIESIAKEFDGKNFCDLVTEYSEDPGSVADCGKYTFAKGDFNNPEFENPSFDLKVGEHAIVKTVFGYHLINKLADLPARTLNLSEVYDSINSTLYDETAQERFDALMKELRDKAVIVNYMTKTEGNDSILVPLETTSLNDFAKCLTEKGAKFYGASWCGHCNNQKKTFGDAMQYVTYIECADEDNPQVQTEACDKAGIGGYPTWVINGKEYPGEQSLERLAQLSGCGLPE